MVVAMIDAVPAPWEGAGTGMPEAPHVRVLEYLPQMQTGSGGMLGTGTFNGWLRLDATAAVLHVVSRRAGEQVHSARPISERLSALKEALQASITDMALLFDVARPSIYAWMQDSRVPRKEKLQRLQHLEQVAEQVAALHVPRMATFINRPLHGGQSLLDLLSQDAPVGDALLQIRDLAYAEEALRRQPKGRDMLRSAQDAADSVGQRGSHREV